MLAPKSSSVRNGMTEQSWQPQLAHSTVGLLPLTMSVQHVDLLDVDLYLSDPYPTFRELRASQPISWQADPGFWAVTTHAEITAIARDHESFSSATGTDIDDMPSDFVRSILHMDPPRHTKVRKLLSLEFAPRNLARVEPLIRETAIAILDGLSPAEPLDFASQVADELPMHVLGRLIGIPTSDDKRFKAWNLVMIAASDPWGAEVRAVTQEMVEYFSYLRAERVREPRDDLVTRLALARVDDQPLDDQEYFGNLRTLMTGGQDTTSNLISGGVRELGRRPELWSDLRRFPGALESAIEEMLRYVLGVTHLVRRAVRDVAFGDVSIKAGEKVALFFLSGNRDEQVFEDPDRFDILRHPNPHLAFGFGRHFCIGAPLARLEARVMLEELLGRFESVETGECERIRSRVFPGISSMQAVLHPLSD